MDRTGTKALVTGAAKGIGKGIAERLLADGAEVVVVDIDADGLESTFSGRASTLVADLGDPDQRQLVVKAGSGVDHLVNAAGVLRVKPILEVTVEDWRLVQQVNAESTFFLCQGIGPTMRPGGSIVNFSSVSAKLATTVEVAPYAASKTTILSITRSFAYALAHIPITVNAVCPGIIDTPMQDTVLEQVAALRGVPMKELSDRRTAGVPLGRVASTAEIAGFVAYLLSPEASYITGQGINYDGGYVTW